MKESTVVVKTEEGSVSRALFSPKKEPESQKGISTVEKVLITKLDRIEAAINRLGNILESRHHHRENKKLRASTKECMEGDLPRQKTGKLPSVFDLESKSNESTASPPPDMDELEEALKKKQEVKSKEKEEKKDKALDKVLEKDAIPKPSRGGIKKPRLN